MGRGKKKVESTVTAPKVIEKVEPVVITPMVSEKAEPTVITTKVEEKVDVEVNVPNWTEDTNITVNAIDLREGTNITVNDTKTLITKLDQVSMQDEVNEIISTICKDNDTKKMLQLIDKFSTKSLIEVENFSSNIQASFKLGDQIKIFQMVLSKINLCTESIIESLYPLKMECLISCAVAMTKLLENETKEQIKFKEFLNALIYLDEANEINILQKIDSIFDIEETIKSLILNYSDKDEAFEFAEQSLCFRKDKFTENHPAILVGLLNVAEIGYDSDNKEIQVEALQYATESYNMGQRINKLDSVKLSLKYMSEIYKKFGNVKLSEKLLSDLEYLQAKQNSEPSEIVSRQIIVKKGSVDKQTLIVREKIQESILDKISQAAAKGKWIEKTIIGEYGVVGYLDETYLSKQLGSELNQSEENIKIALMLCFEAINLGIMSSIQENIVCAIIFAQKYPDILTEININHPEYYVDGHIMKSISSDQNFMSDLLIDYTDLNNQRNMYQEVYLTKIIEERLNVSILNPIKKIIKSGEWNAIIEKELIDYASDEYLKSYNYKIPKETSPLGCNLSAINDATNIAKLLIFTTIHDAIEESKSTNYQAITSFVENYKDIVVRILDTHPEYLTNKHIKKICVDNTGWQEHEYAFDQSMILGSASTDLDIAEEVPQIGDNLLEVES